VEVEDLSFEILGHLDWKPQPGIKGQLIASGVKRILVPESDRRFLSVALNLDND